MYTNLLSLLWLFSVIVTFAESQTRSGGIYDVFQIKQGTDTNGGCAAELDTLSDWWIECQTMVAAGLQALKDAQDTSSANNAVALRYIMTYFHMETTDNVAMTLVQNYLDKVNQLLGGEIDDPRPWLFCNDDWLEKASRSDVVMDKDENEIDTWHPMAIEDVPDYRNLLWTYNTKTGSWTRNTMVPYWSDDLREYLMDENYGDKSLCTSSGGSLGATQEQTDATTITLCPVSFNSNSPDTLGAVTPSRFLSIQKVSPKSATLYHELFHLALGGQATPDVSYDWNRQARNLKKPTAPGYALGERVKDSTMSWEQIYRMNPETYVWFCVGYWYFQQTSWDARWTFETGAGAQVSI